MRSPFLGAIAVVSAMLVLPLFVAAQTAQAERAQAGQALSPWKFHPTDRPIGDGGPVPKRDLTGTWAGPR